MLKDFHHSLWSRLEAFDSALKLSIMQNKDLPLRLDLLFKHSHLIQTHDPSCRRYHYMPKWARDKKKFLGLCLSIVASKSTPHAHKY